MKGDFTFPVACPIDGCSAIVGPRRTYRTRQRHASERQMIRQAVREHLNLRHYGLGPREVSLILDRVCDELQGTVRMNGRESGVGQRSQVASPKVPFHREAAAYPEGEDVDRVNGSSDIRRGPIGPAAMSALSTIAGAAAKVAALPLTIALRHVWLPAGFKSRDHGEQIAHSLLKVQVAQIGTDLGFNSQMERKGAWHGKIDVVFLPMGDDTRIVHAIEIDWLPKARSVRKLLCLPDPCERWILYYREGSYPSLESIPRRFGGAEVLTRHEIPSDIHVIHVSRRRQDERRARTGRASSSTLKNRQGKGPCPDGRTQIRGGD